MCVPTFTITSVTSSHCTVLYCTLLTDPRGYRNVQIHTYKLQDEQNMNTE